MRWRSSELPSSRSVKRQGEILWWELSLVLWLATLAAQAGAGADPAARNYGAWHSGVIGSGGYLQHVVFCPSDARRLYLTTDVGGLYRSDDAGQHWHMLHGALPPDAGSYSVRGLVVSPTDADHVVAASGAGTRGRHGIFVSDDAGNTWRQTLDAPTDGNGNQRADGFVLVASPADADTLYFGALLSGLYRSDDAGNTWKPLGPDKVDPRDLVIDRSNSKRLWLNSARLDDDRAKAPAALFLSEDGGENWQSICTTPPREMVQDPADAATLIGLAGRRQVVRSHDGGRTWEDDSAGLPPFPAQDEARSDGNFGAINVSRGSVIIGSNGGVFYRLDSKTNVWEKVVCEGVDEGDWWGRMQKGSYRHFGSAMGFVGVDPHDPDHWAFTDWYALYQTFDAGRHWKLTVDGIEMTVVHTVAQDPGDPGVVHVGVADLGYFRSTDDGGSFSWVHDDISNNVKGVSVCQAQPRRVYATGPQRWEWLANQVFVSDDDGRSWHRGNHTGLPDMEKARCNTVAASPVAPDAVYLAVSGETHPDGGGVYRSVDAGQSWTWVGQGLPAGQRLFHADIWVAGPELAVSADGSMVAISIDHRQTFTWNRSETKWHEIKLSGAAPHAVVTDPSIKGRFYLAGREGGLQRSDDGGETWTRVLTAEAWEVAVDCRDSRRVAVITGTGVLYSQDAGRRWLSIGRDLPYRAGRNVVAFAGDRIVVGTGGSGVFWIAVRDAVTTGTPFPAVAAASGR